VQQWWKMAYWIKALRANDGAEIAEFAAVLPLVVLFLFAILWFGRAYNIYTTITYAAREGAKVAVVGNGASCATCGAPPGPVAAAAAAAARISEVLQASHIDPGQARVYSPNPFPTGGACGAMTTTSATMGAGAVNVYTNAQLNAVTSIPPACGVVVSFQYPFNFLLVNAVPPFGTNAFNLRLKAAAQMQEEN
jgi:hypothetical protein